MSDVVKPAANQPLKNVFVYGTLKRYQSNHSIIRDAKFLGEAHAPGILLDLGAYPGMLECEEGGQQVFGELFEVKDELQWDALDTLEGHPFHYKRTPIKTTEGYAYTYIYQHYNPTRSAYRLVTDGIWTRTAPLMPFLGFRKTLEGMTKVNAYAHLHDEKSGFAGLINLYTGGLMTTNGKENLRPHYTFNYAARQWELTKPAKTSFASAPLVPVVDTSKLPVVVKTTAPAAKYVDETDPGEEDIGAVVNA